MTEPRVIAADCLSGGGAMGEMMRAHDWSQTPLGPMKTWPQSLRTAVSIVLESRFPMYIAWGPDYTQFYNDAYRPILGSTKHPAALGISTRETFKEIWDIIGPMFDGVMQGTAVGVEDFLLPLDRHGFVEECYFIFSYSPIRDESGRVGGVLVTVTETTQRILGERRLETLRALSAAAVDVHTAERACEAAGPVLAHNAADLPFALLYLVDEGGTAAELATTTGAIQGDQLAPTHVALDDTARAWPIGDVIRTGEAVVADVPAGLASPPEAPAAARAIVVPIRQPGEPRPVGVIVAGLSPRLLLDAPYRSFIELVAGQIGNAIASARAVEEAKARAEALAEIDQAKTAFFSNVSHEFRTPLTLMLGPMEDALGVGALTGDELRAAYRNALRLLKLVNSLLDFSRIEARRVQASFAPTDLAALTTDIASQFRAAIERAGLTLNVSCPPLPEPAYIDGEMWEKIVLNLLSNAFKFTFEGTITVSVAAHDHSFELTVRDTGVGVAAEELPRLFERFHRIEGTRSRTHEGSGIGLALVYELVKMHGGTIRAESTLGEGTAFHVTIPAGSAHLPKERIGAASTLASTALGATPFVEESLHWLGEQAAETDVDALDATAPSAQRILVADDNADMRAYIARLLARHWTVEVVGDGEQALQVVRRDPPALLLTDVMMPNLDGFGLLRAVRDSSVSRGVPVMMLSARAGEEARIEALQQGADDYLVKPFSARELIARVKSQLALADARRAVEKVRDELYQLFTQAPAPICVLRGENLVFEMANPLYETVSGHTELAGKTLLEGLPELAGQGYDDLLRSVMRSGNAYIGRESLVRLDRRGDGNIDDTFFTFVYAPMRSETGVCDRVMVFCMDVTDQVVARQHAEAANRAKDEFLAMLGHEMRNPLAPILTALDLMRLRDSDMWLKERGIIERHVKHMVRLVDDLLDVSRIARGHIELQRERVEIGSILARALEMTGPLLEQRKHELLVDVPRSGLVVNGDVSRLAQVMANLLTNAGKYTPPGGRIHVAATRDSDHVTVRVRDNGTGIEPEMLPKIFDLFVQERQSLDRSQGGLGIGLAIVKNLVTLHGGTIEAHSAGRGRGTEVIVRLPASAAAPS